MGETRYAGTKIHIPTCKCQRCTLKKISCGKDCLKPTPEPTIPSWRQMDHADEDEFRNWLNECLDAREALGRKRYQSHIYGFQGDSFEHLGEELLDAIKYYWVEKRRRGG